MKEIIRDEDYRREIPRTAGRVFLFFGEEDYLKLAALRETRAALCPDPAMAFFNDITIDFTDYTPERLLDAMAAPPMMTEAKLIVLRDFDFTAARATEMAEDLLTVLAQIEEYDYNCIIIYAAQEMLDWGYLPKRPSAMLRRLGEIATPVWFEAPKDARLARWAGKHFAHYGVTAAPEVCTALISYAGKTMFVLANEIEKLAFFVKEHGRSKVTAADIRTVAVPAMLPDTFALSNAILEGNGRAALDALAVLKFERVEPTVILGDIARVFGDLQGVRVLLDAGKSTKEISAALKMHEYKVGILVKSLSGISPARFARVIDLVAATDLQIKSTYADYGPLERLIAAIG